MMNYLYSLIFLAYLLWKFNINSFTRDTIIKRVWTVFFYKCCSRMLQIIRYFLNFTLIFFLFVVPPVRLLPFTYPHPRFPFLSLSSRQRSPPLIMRPQPFSPTTVSHLHQFARGHRNTAENLVDTVGHFTQSVPSLQSLKKWLPAQRFDIHAADQRSSI